MTSAAFEPIRVGLVGYGLAGAVFHAPLIATTAGMALSMVSTRDPDRVAGLSRDYTGIEVVSSAQDLIARSSELDMVVIATPNESHARIAHMALDAGLAVVVDKPLAVTSEQAQSVVDHAFAVGALLSVFQNRRWDSDFLTLQGLIRAGKLGDINRFESRFERWRPEIGDNWRERPDASVAGGVLFDLGSHLVDQTIALFGKVSHVYGEIDIRRTNALIDDDSFIALTHQSGTRSHLWMSAATAQVGPRFRVLGSAGAFSVSGLDPQEGALTRGDRPASRANWGAVPPQLWGTVGTDDHSVVVPAVPGDYPAYYAGIVAALHGEAEIPVNPRDSVAVLRVLEAARQSAAESRVVTIDEHGSS